MVSAARRICSRIVSSWRTVKWVGAITLVAFVCHARDKRVNSAYEECHSAYTSCKGSEESAIPSKADSCTYRIPHTI
jgi:hypothetical protein